jgi:hypothetical protein
VIQIEKFARYLPAEVANFSIITLVERVPGDACDGEEARRQEADASGACHRHCGARGQRPTQAHRVRSYDLQALELLARDSMKVLQELADEAFRDLLKKHGRPSSLKDALRQSTRQIPANDPNGGRATRRRKGP